MNIADLEIGQIAIVDRVINTGGEQGIVQRLAAMGVVSDKSVQVLRKAKFNGPLHIRVGATTEIAIRPHEAEMIVIKTDRVNEVRSQKSEVRSECVILRSPFPAERLRQQNVRHTQDSCFYNGDLSKLLKICSRSRQGFRPNYFNDEINFYEGSQMIPKSIIELMEQVKTVSLLILISIILLVTAYFGQTIYKVWIVKS